MRERTIFDRAVDILSPLAEGGVARAREALTVLTQRNLVDSAIGYFSPRSEFRRMQARNALDLLKRSAFDGASRGNRTKNWTTTNADINTTLLGNLQYLRNRSRDLVRNNPWADRAIEVIESNVVGSGIKPQARSPDPKVAALYEALWAEWAEDDVLCDADGLLDFYGLQGLVMRTVAESGSCLIRRRKRFKNDGLPLPLQIQVLEPDYLDTTRPRIIEPNGNIIVQGVEYDTIGRRVAYWLFEHHPGGTWPLTQGYASNRVPAEEIIHVFRVERQGQVDGIPWASPVLMRLRDLDDFEDAALIQQKIAACYVAFEHDMEAPDDPTKLTSDKRDELEQMEPGTRVRLGPGRDVTIATPPAPQGFGPFTQNFLRSIACGYGITYESLTNDYSQVNFSSGRMGWIEMNRNVKKWQSSMLVPRLCRGVWRWFVEASLVSGRAREIAGATWTPPRREMIDPVKETEAKKAQVRSGFISLSESIREEGRDPEAVFTEMKADLDTLDKLKITFDTDPRKPATGGGPSNPTVPQLPNE